MDYTKCYAADSTGRRGSYPTSKLTYTPNADVNGFAFSVTSNSGYGVEFPVALESGKRYTVNYESGDVFPTLSLFKYNADGTINEITKLATVQNTLKTINIVAEDGCLYSIFLATSSTSTNVTVNAIAVSEHT